MTLQKSISIIFASVFFLMLFQISVLIVAAQTSISSGTITGTAVDPNNAVVSNANIEVFNAVTNYRQVAQTDSNGNFRFNNVPFNSYRLTISANGFEPLVRQIKVQTIVPLNLISQSLAVLGTQATVEITRPNLNRCTMTGHQSTFSTAPITARPKKILCG